MNGLAGMRGVKVVTGAAAAVLLMACVGPTPALGGYHRGCAGARLSEQSAAQCAARPGALHRRERAAGAVRLSTESRAHRQRRLPVHRYEYHRGRLADRDRADRNSRRQRAAQRRPDGHADAVQRPANRQQDPRRRRARFPARAKRCGCSSRRCCWRPPPSTWTNCATPPSSRFRRATFAFSSRR